MQATVALLQAWLDYFPWPSTWTGGLQQRSVPRKSDPKQLSRVVCDQCGGEGCRACWFKGSFVGDPYLAERGLVPHTLDSFARFVDCDSCGGWGRMTANPAQKPSKDHPVCERCLGLGKVPGLAGGPLRFHDETNGHGRRYDDADLDALDRGHARRDDLRIYRDRLVPALAELRDRDRYGHFLIEWVWVLGAQNPQSLPLKGLVALLAATRSLEAALPDGFERSLPAEIRAQADHRNASLARAKGKSADKVARAKRDAEIRRLHQTGEWTLDELARRFDLDKSRISRITRESVR